MHLEERIQKLEERNARVEQEKAWEVSLTRKLSLTSITYLVMVLVLFQINNASPFVNALVPTLGYFLSTQSLPFIKKWWANNK